MSWAILPQDMDPFESLNAMAQQVPWPEETPIGHLRLSTRVYNILKREDIDTLADLREAKFHSLTPNGSNATRFGASAAQELLLALAAAKAGLTPAPEDGGAR